jgi:hypothetical protein
MNTICSLAFPTFWFVVDDLFEEPSVISEKTVTCGCDPVVETYVRRWILLFEIFVLREVGGQVKDVCGGNAYEVMSLEEEI